MTTKKLVLFAVGAMALIIGILIIAIVVNSPAEKLDAHNHDGAPNDSIHGFQHPPMPDAPAIGDVTKLEEFIHINPNDIPHLQMLADLYAEKNNPKSRELFRKLIGLNHQVADNWVALGQTFNASSEMDSIITCNMKALLADASNPKALYNLGAIAANSGDTKKALDYWHRVDLKLADAEVTQLVTNGLKILHGEKK
ncbi:MAG: hypothetical protein LCH54_10055 [Bacteroidetes bacterium]|nr:hypothetical protein [Bacteroidota bacterium]